MATGAVLIAGALRARRSRTGIPQAIRSLTPLEKCPRVPPASKESPEIHLVGRVCPKEAGIVRRDELAARQDLHFASGYFAELRL